MQNDRPISVKQLKACLHTAAFAFRGYDVANLGRSSELLAHAVYGAIVREELERASRACTEIAGRAMDLVARVEAGRETTWETYPEAVVLILAMEMAQIRLLDEIFGIQCRSARLAYGYSLGELAALVAGAVFPLEEILRVSLPLAEDTVKLAADVTMAVLFSRERELPIGAVRRLCLLINKEGLGVIGISTFLSPNSLLLLGQRDTLERFGDRMGDTLSERIHLRKKEGRWAPLHTPIIWENNLRTRFAVSTHTMAGGLTTPVPPVLSLATGQCSYDDTNAREMLDLWFDRPQRLWDAVYTTLALGIDTVVHVGPAPSMIPAMFARLRNNVERQTKVSLGVRVLSALANRSWLRWLLPDHTALMRSLYIQHVVLEDWLLEQDVSTQHCRRSAGEIS